MITNEADKTIEQARIESEIDDYDDNADATIYNCPNKTPYDGVRRLWANVLFLAVEYATGNVTNDHDCGGKPEVKEQFRRSSIRFLTGNGNLRLACEAANQDMATVIRVGRRYQHLLTEPAIQ